MSVSGCSRCSRFVVQVLSSHLFRKEREKDGAPLSSRRHVRGGASLLVDALQAKQECAPTQFRPHLHGDVVSVVSEPGPDGSFALEWAGGCLGPDAHGVVCSRGSFHLLLGLHVGADLGAFAAITDGKSIGITGL